MKEKLKELKVKNFIAIFIAGIVNAIGVTLFLFPVKLYDSGISGLSMLLDQITPDYLVLSMFLIVLNVPIFIFGYKKQGLTFTIYSIFAIAIYSLTAFLITNVFSLDLTNFSPFANDDLLLCAVFGGALSGLGSGIVIKFGGAIDGIDVLSVIFAKKLGISVGTFVFIYNIILYIVCGIIFQSWILPLYSIITYFIGSKTVDFIVEGINGSKCAMIVTTKANEVSDAINKTFTTSGTIVKAKGGYTKIDNNIIYFIVNRFQINKLKTIVREIDNNAFISLLDVSDIIKQKDNIQLIDKSTKEKAQKSKK